MERSIDFSKFRKLLATLENSPVKIRLRCAGERYGEFSNVLLLSENAMILQHQPNKRMIVNLRDVAEFELDHPLLDLEANGAYNVVP